MIYSSAVWTSKECPCTGTTRLHTSHPFFTDALRMWRILHEILEGWPTWPLLIQIDTQKTDSVGELDRWPKTRRWTLTSNMRVLIVHFYGGNMSYSFLRPLNILWPHINISKFNIGSNGTGTDWEWRMDENDKWYSYSTWNYRTYRALPKHLYKLLLLSIA